MSKPPGPAPIPFVPEESPSWDEGAGAGVIAENVVIDGAGAVYRRPGIVATSYAPSTVIDAAGIVGLYVTNESKLFAVSNAVALGQRPIYYLTGSGSLKLGGGVDPSGLRGTLRPVFAETELLVVIAGGDAIQKIVKTTNTSARLGGSPPSASHVILQSNRILANDKTVDQTKVRYSDVALGSVTYAGHELWTTGIGGAGYFTAEARPDNVQALADNTNEAAVLGTGTTQSFQPDPQLVFAPTATIEAGLSAPYSVVKIDQKYLFLDQLRRFVVTDGRTFQVISGPIQRVLDEMTTTSDCFGQRVTAGFVDAVAWTFPADGRTFVFAKGTWSQWSSFSAATDNWGAFAMTAADVLPDRGTTIVGTADGKVGALSLAAQTDLGQPIVASVTTGYLNRDTDMRKRCKAVRLTLRRGRETTNPTALLCWRDRPGEWQQRVPIRMGASGDTESVVTLRSLGIYRRRQWRFEFSGPETFVLVSAVEEFETLEM